MSQSNDRETKTLVLKDANAEIGKHAVVVKTYLTGRELREIDAASVSSLNLTSGEKVERTKLTESFYTMRQDKQIEAVVVSVDGETENIVDRVLDLPGSVSLTVIDHVLSVAEPKKEVPDNQNP